MYHVKAVQPDDYTTLYSVNKSHIQSILHVCYKTVLVFY